MAEPVAHQYAGFGRWSDESASQPLCTCEGAWNLRDGYCLVERRAVNRAAVEAFAAELRDGLDHLPRDDHWGTLIRPGDVEDLIARLLLEDR